MTGVAIATGREAHARAQRNIVLGAYDELLGQIATYQLAGVLAPEVAAELCRMASNDLETRLSELDTFEAREQPSRLRRTPGASLYELGGVGP
jgi:hypothetical protein